MSGPKGHQVTLPFSVDGERLFMMRRASTYKRRVFKPVTVCRDHEAQGKIQKRSQCSACNGLYEPKSVPDVDAVLGVTAPADTEEGQRQREAVAALPPEMKAAAKVRAEVAHRAATAAAEQVPQKFVCGLCDDDSTPVLEWYCEESKTFVSNLGLAYLRDRSGHLLLTERQQARLAAAKLRRGIHFLGTLPDSFNFEEWQPGDSFSLVPDEKDTLIHACRTALHIIGRGILVYYCSADESGFTYKNEWVAVIQAAQEGKSLMLTQIRANNDTAHRSHPLMNYTQGPVHSFVGLFMARQISRESLKTFSNDSRARRDLSGMLDGASTDFPTADPIQQPADISGFISEIRKSQQVPQPVEE